MKSIIVGTAGHIDHGKTALVKALTGIDADRLEEEKRRGITIDLGFAHMDLPAGNGETLRLGFVDVPGHERFVRNMLAGVGGIDLVLFVVAADESIKPQTREHFDILELLGVQRGIAVITKCDAVDAETLKVTHLEVEDFLRSPVSGKPRFPIVAVSSLTGAGLDQLKAALVEESERVAERDSQALTRLPIDRVFTIKGFGTVVTGTLVAGTIRVGDELEVLPGGQRARVRGLEVHGRTVAQAQAGQRVALNLAGASREDLVRGMVLAPPATFETTRLAEVYLTLLPSAPRPLKDRTRVHFHCQTMETVAEIILETQVKSSCFGKEPQPKPAGATGTLQMAPGQEWKARIKLAESAFLLPRDRFIIRQLSPAVTIGGGSVFDIANVPRRKPVIDPTALTAATEDPASWLLGWRIARRGVSGISLAKLIAETGEPGGRLEEHSTRLLAQGAIVRAGNLFLYAPVVKELSGASVVVVSDFHKKNPLVPGMGKEALREKLKLSPEVFAVVLESLAREKKLEIAGDLLRMPGHSVVMKDEEAESKKKIEEAFATAGLRVPALPDVLAGLKVDKARAQKIVTLLLRDKVLIKISDELVLHRDALKQLRTELAAYKAKAAKIDVAKFKELTGVSRKYAIPLLEYLDRERVTRRVGDAREIL